MLPQRQHVIPENLFQVRISRTVVQGIELRSRVSSLFRAVGQIMLQIRVPVVSERCVQVFVHGSVLHDVNELVHGTPLVHPKGDEMVPELLPVVAERLFQIRVAVRVIVLVEYVLKRGCESLAVQAEKHAARQAQRRRPPYKSSDPCPFFQHLIILLAVPLSTLVLF